MKKIIIKGEFTVETDFGWIKGMRQPFRFMELEVVNCCRCCPVRCTQMTSVDSVQIASQGVKDGS